MLINRLPWSVWCGLWLATVWFPKAQAAEKPPAAEKVVELLATIGQVGPQGGGSMAARAARDELAKRGVEILPPLLSAMDTKNVVAVNWYRTVYEEIVARELAR